MFFREPRHPLPLLRFAIQERGESRERPFKGIAFSQEGQFPLVVVATRGEEDVSKTVGRWNCELGKGMETGGTFWSLLFRDFFGAIDGDVQPSN